MRKIVRYLGWVLIVAVLVPSTVLAVPGVMSYQGKLNNSSGRPFSGIVTMTFTIYNAPTGGDVLWTEPATGAQSVTVTNGIFNVELGSIQPFPDTLFSNDTLYLGIRVDLDDEMIPRQRITSGIYAFKAKAVEYNVPIGTIMAWAKGLAGVPALPDGWVECNGQKLADPLSPLNGKDLPNLNGALKTDGTGTREPQRFLRGGSTSGSVGGSESFSWYHDHARGPSSNTYYSFSGNTNSNRTDHQGGQQDLKPPFYEVVWIMKVK